jgi:hypothetical protein
MDEPEVEVLESTLPTITVKLPTILDGKYFTVVTIVGKKVKARCNFCAKASSIIEGFTAPTSNFSSHLKVIKFNKYSGTRIR